MENTFFVYELLDPRAEPPVVFYVGISRRHQKRYRPMEHILEAKRKKLSKYANVFKIGIIRKILVAGLEPIIMEVFQSSKENVFEKEKELISLYGRRDKNLGTLTNLTDGGEGSMDDQARQKLRDRLHGKTFADLYGEEKAKELLQECSKRTSGKNNPMFGKTHSESAKKSISHKNKGKSHPGSERQREAAILSNKTRVLSDSTLKKMSDVKKGKVYRPAGFNLSEDHKQKISEARKGKICDQTIYHWFHNEFGERQYRRVDLIAEFPNLRSEAICRVVNGLFKHHAGWSLR
jgi:hypothetical protein